MVIDKNKTEELLKKAREAMYPIKSHFEIKFGCRVADYGGLTYKTKFSEGSDYIFKAIRESTLMIRTPGRLMRITGSDYSKELEKN